MSEKAAVSLGDVWLDPAGVDLVARDEGRGVPGVLAADLSAAVADLKRRAIVSAWLCHIRVGRQGALVTGLVLHAVVRVRADSEMRLFEELKTLLGQAEPARLGEAFRAELVLSLGGAARVGTGTDLEVRRAKVVLNERLKSFVDRLRLLILG